MRRRLVRMWINQPSTSQPAHRFHGRCVLADPPYPVWGAVAEVYFVDGAETSAIIPLVALSEGWPEHLRRA